MTMWFLAGILFSGIITVLYLWLRGSHVVVKWYEWLIVAVGMALLIFGLQNYRATLAEHWSIGTPFTFLLVFVVPALILLAIAAFLLWWRQYRHRSAK
jgi:hypothetical protein